MAAQRWGWHRLADRWAERVVTAAGVRPGELVLDLGAGDGALTAALVARGARVWALELHPARVAALRRRFADAPVRVVPGDVATVRFPSRPFRVVANPPYGSMVSLLRRLLDSSVYAADLVLPASYVAQVVGGRTPSRRRSWRYARGLYVPRAAFRPPPRVDSAVLVVRRSHTGR